MLPYLSVVAVSRNDDHGGNPLIRTQIFITNFARQCEKYRLPAELIIVDWNPVAGRLGLAAVLNVPPEVTYLRTRVITVPTALHRRLKYADLLPLFQMIAKNAGIRRAKGRFVLATNIDILFSDELVLFISRQRLDPKKQYRVDRYDIQSGLPKESTLDEVRDYAWRHPIRSHRRYQPEKLVAHLYGAEIFKKSCVPDPEFRRKIDGVDVVYEDDVWQVRPERSVNMSHLHTNGCGDFTLLAREGWDAIRGYPEFSAYSFNIDSMGVIAAHYAGYEEVSLLPPCVCFHIEHGIGSGWTPEGEKYLFNRLEKAGILNPEWSVLTPLVEKMRTMRQPLEFNHAGWGLADFDLPECAMGDMTEIPESKLKQLAVQAETHAVSAIQPAYDLDRLTLAYDRNMTSNLGSTVIGSAKTIESLETVVLYIPDRQGNYAEKRSLRQRADLAKTATLLFRLENFESPRPLRFDPCQRSGLVCIRSITAFDLQNNRMIWEFDGGDSKKFKVRGTAMWANPVQSSVGRRSRFFLKNAPQSFCLTSTGTDPQLIFPTLPEGVGSSVVISNEMKFMSFGSFPTD